MELALPGGNRGIRGREVRECEEPGTVTGVWQMDVRDVSKRAVPLGYEVLGPEMGQVRLLCRPAAARPTSPSDFTSL